MFRYKCIDDETPASPKQPSQWISPGFIAMNNATMRPMAKPRIVQKYHPLMATEIASRKAR
jgi:hypothetical protein